MSDLSIGLVVEGPTDALVIEAGLRYILDNPFTYATLQPQVPTGEFGGGWGGVFRWCRQVASVGGATLSDNPTLAMHDLFIIQVDADVAGFRYGDANVSDPPANDLPCEQACPPALDTVCQLSEVVKGWLAPSELGRKGVLCIPSKCIEAWVAAGLYGQSDPEFLDDLECDLNIVAYLHGKPSRERLVVMKKSKVMNRSKFKKRRARYQRNVETLTRQWKFIERWCPQAKTFREAVEEAIG